MKQQIVSKVHDVRMPRFTKGEVRTRQGRSADAGLFCMNRLLIALVGVFVGITGVAGVFDDAGFWFDGAKGGTSPRTFATGDALDIRHCAMPSDAINQAKKCNGAPEVRTVTVKRNLRGDTVEQQVLRFKQSLKDQVFDESTGKLTSANASNFQSLEFADTMGVIERQKPFSVVVRFKLDQSMLAEWAELRGAQYSGLRSTLVNVGGEEQNRGLTLNLEYDNYNYNPGRYVIAERGKFNQQLADLGTLETNKWYELAVSCRLGATVDKNYLRLALAKEDGTITFVDCKQLATTKDWDPTGEESRRVIVASSRNDSWQADEPVNTSSSWFRSFNGEVATLAFWSRSISDLEIREALKGVGFPLTFPDIVRVGVDNDSSGEFAGSAASATVVAKDPESWRNLPAQFSEQNQSVDIKFKISDDADYMTGVGQMLLVKGASGSGMMRASLGAFSSEFPVSTTMAYVKIPGTSIATGELTLTLTRLSGTFSLDSVALGGSWQIGKNNFSAGEVGQGDMWTAALHDYAIVTDDLKKFGSTMYRTGGSTASDTLRFNLSQSLAQSCPFEFTFNCRQVTDNGQKTSCDVYVNGVCVCQGWAVRDNSRQKLRIPARFFVPGENSLKLSNTVAAANYVAARAFILEVQRPSKGLVITVR